MKHFLSILLPVLLCQCGAVTVIKPDGSLYAHEGILDEADGTIFEATLPNGTKVTRIASKPNRTRVANNFVDFKKAIGLGGLLKDERVNANNNSTKVKLMQEETKQIPLKAEGEAKVIEANAAAAESAKEE